MKNLLFILAIELFSCRQSSSENKKVVDKQKIIEARKLSLTAVGEKIQGDFNGDGQIDFATATKIKEGQGNPVEDGSPDEYEVSFSADNLKSISGGCCDIRLINEGDLNNDGADEISIFQAPMNGCAYSLTTYSFINGDWKQVVGTFLIPTGCDNISDEGLQKRVYKEGDLIYYLDTDPNDENGKLVKKKATIK